jgi:hypothetical protein
MTPQESVQELLAQLARAGDESSPAQAAKWVRDELIDAWDAARREARLAYLAWSEEKTTDTYVVFLAARDRADAAQDALANWTRERR